MRQSELIRAAYEGKNTLVIKNANVVNVFTDEIVRADVAVYEDVIIGVGSYSGENEIDAGGAYLAPGFIDAHVHIESSMVIPSSFMKVIMPHGTTTVIADPHEIANVAGAAGIRAMYKLTDELPLRVLFMLPSCVPATPFEHSGAKLVAEDMEQFMHKSRILGLGEVMDANSVINCSQEMLDKLRLFDKRPIDGHAPMLEGMGLNAYRVAGAFSDHECSTYEEVKQKLATGMNILLRIGSAANNMDGVLRRIAKEKLPTRNMMFCTDDKHIEDIRREGHINANARMAVAAGIDPIDAIKMASYNAARAYGIRGVGAIAPGYKADMVLLEDLKDFKVKQVISRFGRPYTGEEQIPSPILPPQVFNSVRLPEISKYDLALRCHVSAPVIKMIPHQLVTELVYRDVERDENGCFIPSEGMVKLAVIERHHATGSMAVGILEGLGIKHGAVASTVAHDSHNLVVAGDNDEDMLMAIESLRDCGGGYSVVSRGVVLARLPLPIAGLMTAAPVNDVLEIQALLDALYSLGAKRDSDPLIALSFMALPVIPAVKLTDEGLFDAVNFKFIKYN